MTKARSTVYAVDDDPSVRRSLSRLLAAHGFHAEVFSRAGEFLALSNLKRPSCLILDVRLPDKSGINLQKEMYEKGINVPIIFITGHGDINMSVKAMKAGAVDFLPKPFTPKALFKAISYALFKDRAELEQTDKISRIKERIKTLTPREHSIYCEVIKGKLNKQIADDLGIALKTVKIHRGNVMRKMKASSAIDLANMARQAGYSL